MRWRVLGVLVSGLLVAAVGCQDDECSGPIAEILDADCNTDIGEPFVPETEGPMETMPPKALTKDAAPGWTSSRAMAVHGSELFVLDRTNAVLRVLNRADLSVVRQIELEARPYDLIVDAEGAALVTLRYGGKVVRIEPGQDKVSAEAAVGVGPTGLAMSPNGERLFVAVTEENAVVALDPVSLQSLGSISSPRPRAVVALGNMNVMLTTERAGVQYKMLRLDQRRGGLGVDLQTTFELRANGPMEEFMDFDIRASKANAPFAAVHHPEQNQVLVAHQMAFGGDEELVFNPPRDRDVQADTSYGGGGFGSFVPKKPVEPAVTPVPADGNDPAPFNPFDDSAPVMSGDPAECDSPSDINHHPEVTLALMTCAGSDTVMALNTRFRDPMVSPMGIIEVGQAPTAVVFSPDGKTAYVLDNHGFDVSTIDLNPILKHTSERGTTSMWQDSFKSKRLSKERTVKLGDDPMSEQAQLGRRIFTFNGFNGLSGDGDFACASCHPEGTEDGAVWFGAIGPRQTPALAGRLQGTAPFNWLGNEQTLSENFVRTVSRMGGNGLSDAELEALEVFVMDWLQPPPRRSHALELTDQEELGRQLFNDSVVGCANRHNGAEVTNGKADDVGTSADVEAVLAEEGLLEHDQPGIYDTPSLRDLYRTAPYLHDGSADTLMEVLDRTATTMGRTDHLTIAQKQALVAYLLTL